MFSLIITIIAIALVAALAMAVIYYGRTSTKEAQVRASAATLLNQSSQIASAGALAVSQGAEWPDGAPMFTQPYLTTMPTPPKSAYGAGDVPTASDWAYYLPGESQHFVLQSKINRDVCLAVNRSQGVIGIPAAWDGKHLVQCFGPGVANGAGEQVYTFFYNPPSMKASKQAEVLNQSVTDANNYLATSPAPVVPADVTPAGASTPVSTAKPGYPILCPSGNYLNEGVCAGGTGTGTGSTTPGNGGGTTTPGEGGTTPGDGDGGSSEPATPAPPSSAGINMECDGVYSDGGMSGWCMVKNNTTNSLLFSKMQGRSSTNGQPLVMSGGTECDGVELAPGDTCEFWPVVYASPGTKIQSPYVIADLLDTVEGKALQGVSSNFEYRPAPNALACTGTYSDIGLKANCTVTNSDVAKSMAVADIAVYTGEGRLLATPTACQGVALEPGQSCSFTFNPPPLFGKGAPASPPTVVIDWVNMADFSDETFLSNSNFTYKAGRTFYESTTVHANPDGQNGWTHIPDIGAIPDQEYYVEFDLVDDGTQESWYSWFEVFTGTPDALNYDFYWFLASHDEIEVDMWSPGSDWAMAPPFQMTGVNRYRIEFHAGTMKRLLVNGVEFNRDGNAYRFYDDAPVQPGPFGFRIGNNAKITRIKAATIW